MLERGEIWLGTSTWSAWVGTEGPDPPPPYKGGLAENALEAGAPSLSSAGLMG